MHKTFISYHHANDQDLKDAIINLGSGEDFVDKSVKDGDIDTDLSEETIMRKIREDYIGESSVVVVIVGEETSERPYINSELQAALWGKPTGFIAVIRDELYDRLYSSSTCTDPDCGCGISLKFRTNEFKQKVPYLARENNTRLENNKSTSPHYSDSEAYCGIYKYSYFTSNLESLIDEAFEKRDKNFDIKKKNINGIKTIKNPWGF